MVQHLTQIEFSALPLGWYFWRKDHPFLWLKDELYVARNLGQSAFEDDIEIPGEELVLAYDNEAVSKEHPPIPMIIEWTGNPDPDY